MEMFVHVGSILDVPSGIIVHGCNAQGKMESGLAKDIKAKWPSAYNEYLNYSRRWGLTLGSVTQASVSNDGNSNSHLIVVNAVTQKDYGRDKTIQYTNYEALRQCFVKVNSLAKSYGLPIHFPLIGCGLGNGKWSEVKKIIDSTISSNVQKHLWVLSETDIAEAQ